MAKQIKVMTVFGTRPEAIKLFPLAHRLASDPRFDSRILVSGQHRGMLDQVLQIADITPHHDLDLMRPNQSLDGLTSAILTEVGRVLDLEQPDWVVVQGDTTTALASAMAAYYRQIPVCHVEAGLRSGNIYHPWPEEMNRRAIGTFATLHCAPTETARNALLGENISSDAIHVTGNTVVDALHWVTGRIGERPEIAGGLAELEARFAGKQIIGLTSHRRENLGEGMRAISRAVRQIAARDDVAVIFPVHLNPRVREIMNTELAGLDNVALIEPLDYPHFARLIDISYLMLTDSGGVQEEAPALGKPVLVLRETTERPEGIEAGTAILVGTDPVRIVEQVSRLLDDRSAYDQMARAHNPFGDGQSSGRIADLLAGSASAA